ncbi:putative ABC transport system permease protein [Saccharothrix coeruleofusca]|uniref:FtsX-like permease family protein n=1 Tax=Saccharothrix coeruleofusca TaxID=33919 RepID=UPI001AE3B916|nr:FtsX-like permease family protein [Saccharothrix coeruleofusca]MBP2336983.1 putative ABC transport system permease protein [Saccharothrix coeruleofusca]
MPTSLRLAVAEFRSRPGRAVLPGVALVVGVACLLASLVLSQAMVQAVEQTAPAVPAGVDHVVRPGTSGGAVLDQAALDRVAALPGVAEVVPVRQVRVDLLLDGGRAGSQRADADVEPDRAELHRIPIRDGRTPARDGEIALDRVTAHQHGLGPGSAMRVADARGRPLDVVVRGVTERGSLSEEPLVVVGEDLAAKLGTPRVVEAHVRGGHAAAVERALGEGFAVRSAAQVVAAAADDADDLRVMLLPFSVLALATSVFVSSATFRAVYAQRQRTTALLRCLGAHRAPLLRANLLEALFTGAVAGVLGALLGGPVALLLARLFDATGLSAVLGAVELSPRLLPSADHLLLGGFVAAALSAFAAVRPSLAAARVAPLSALRSSEGGTPDAAVARRRLVLGLLLVGTAVALAALGVLAKGSIGAVFLVLFSGIAAMAGLFGVLGPVVVPALGLLFGHIAGRFGGAQWKLAAAEVRRVPRRAASVAMPLVLAAAMVTFFAVAVGTAQRVEDEFSGASRPDVMVADVGDRPLPAGAEAAVRRPGAEASVVLHEAESAEVDAQGESRTMTVAGADPRRMRDWLAAQQADAPDFATGQVLLSEGTAQRLDARLGHAVTLYGMPGGARTATFAGTYPGELVEASAVLADPSIAPASRVLVALEPAADPAAYRDGVREVLAGAPTVLVTTRADIAARSQRYLDMGTTLLMVLLGLSAAVAVTGIGTALAISVQERRKELALRRALGVTRGGIQGGVVAEAVLLSLVGLLGGGVFGLVYAELAMAALGVFTWPTAAVPPLLLGGLGVVVLAVLAAAGPARGAARVRPAAGLAAG